MEFVLVIMAIALICSAFKGYKAERYARKTVYGQELSFLDYMCSSHPVMTVCLILLLIIVVIAIFQAIF